MGLGQEQAVDQQPLKVGGSKRMLKDTVLTVRLSFDQLQRGRPGPSTVGREVHGWRELDRFTNRPIQHRLQLQTHRTTGEHQAQLSAPIAPIHLDRFAGRKHRPAFGAGDYRRLPPGPGLSHTTDRDVDVEILDLVRGKMNASTEPKTASNHFTDRYRVEHHVYPPT
jgi:hypothetical protein